MTSRSSQSDSGWSSSDRAASKPLRVDIGDRPQEEPSEAGQGPGLGRVVERDVFWIEAAGGVDAAELVPDEVAQVDPLDADVGHDAARVLDDHVQRAEVAPDIQAWLILELLPAHHRAGAGRAGCAHLLEEQVVGHAQHPALLPPEA